MITPAFTGQIYRDTATGNIWKANSTTPGDWTLLVQDFKVMWLPRNIQLGEKLPFAAPYSGSSGIIGITSVTNNNTTTEEEILFDTCPNLVSVVYPSLLTVTGGFSAIKLSGCLLLTTARFPLLQSVENDLVLLGNPLLNITDFSSLVSVTNIDIETNDILASLSFPSLTTASPTIADNPALTSINLPVWNGSAGDFSGNALDVTTVDLILARCAASGITGSSLDLSGGTNAHPSVAGMANKAALEALTPPWTISIN